MKTEQHYQKPRQNLLTTINLECLIQGGGLRLGGGNVFQKLINGGLY